MSYMNSLKQMSLQIHDVSKLGHLSCNRLMSDWRDVRIAIHGLDPIIPDFLTLELAPPLAAKCTEPQIRTTYNFGTTRNIWCLSLYRSNASRRQRGLKSPAPHASTGSSAGA